MGTFQGRVDPINLQRRIFRHQILDKTPANYGGIATHLHLEACLWCKMAIYQHP